MLVSKKAGVYNLEGHLCSWENEAESEQGEVNEQNKQGQTGRNTSVRNHHSIITAFTTEHRGLEAISPSWDCRTLTHPPFMLPLA